jgi:hypothetical protein
MMATETDAAAGSRGGRELGERAQQAAAKAFCGPDRGGEEEADAEHLHVRARPDSGAGRVCDSTADAGGRAPIVRS